MAVVKKQVIRKILEEYARRQGIYNSQAVADIICDIAASNDKDAARYKSRSAIREIMARAQVIKRSDAEIQDVPELAGKTRGVSAEELYRRIERDAISNAAQGQPGGG